MKVELENQILEFVERFYQKDTEIIEQTKLFLDTVDYDRLVALMETIEQNHSRNAGVIHFEGIGFSYQLLGESLIPRNIEKALAQYSNALASYERGMHFATGAGAGWRFRKLYERAECRRQQIQERNGF